MGASRLPSFTILYGCLEATEPRQSKHSSRRCRWSCRRRARRHGGSMCKPRWRVWSPSYVWIRRVRIRA